jgi:Zn-dependent protease
MIISFLFWIVIFLITVTIHEFAHGVVAYWLGDATAKERGRLSLNPLKHIDPFWTVLLPLVLMWMGAPPIGMAKPVPVNYMRLRHPKRDMIWVAIAGACANLLFAWVLALLFQHVRSALLLLPIYFNVGLAIFNLLPIPPLDGSRVVAGLIPDAWAYRYGKLEPYGMYILIALLWLGALNHVLLPAINGVCVLLNVPQIT